ncbi:MAG TPA: hypothetical protein VGW38_16480 [Chloroflexota bacterium]|nr:hypothetical protein [Chloroflexota bacterium]
MNVYAVYARTPFAALWELQSVFNSQEEADLHAASLVDDTRETGTGKLRDSIVVAFPDRDSAEQHLPEDRVVPITTRFIRPSMEVDIGGHQYAFR